MYVARFKLGGIAHGDKTRWVSEFVSIQASIAGFSYSYQPVRLIDIDWARNLLEIAAQAKCIHHVKGYTKQN